MGIAKFRRHWFELWPLLALCMLQASRWMLEQSFPQTASTWRTEAIGCAMAAGLTGALSLTPGWRRAGRENLELRSVKRAQLVAIAFGALLILTGPAVGLLLAGSPISGTSATIALALVPVVVAVASGAFRTSGGTGSLPGLLWPGLAALAGLLLLLPEPSAGGIRSWTGLAVLPLCVGLGAVMLGGPYEASEGRAKYFDGIGVTGALLLAALCFAALWVTQGRAERDSAWSVQACGLDALVASLTLLACIRLGAVRWSSQFLLVPLLSVAQGIVFMRPVLDARTLAGLACISLGALYQLFGASGSAPPGDEYNLFRGEPEL